MTPPQPRYLLGGVQRAAQLQNSFQEGEPAAKRQSIPSPLTFLLSAPNSRGETDERSFLRLKEMDFSRGVPTWPSRRGRQPSAKPSPSDIWPQRGEAGAQAPIWALTSAKEGGFKASLVQMKIQRPVSLCTPPPAFLELPEV